ncbi:MAG: hypothetical protein O7C59_06140 [Rickettsia endosymbiont of Ixodes persulcatus]|nr:hypothetical protein [Rickettsia endosymbiont of Ixodes persulcatus]
MLLVQFASLSLRRLLCLRPEQPGEFHRLLDESVQGRSLSNRRERRDSEGSLRRGRDRLRDLRAPGGVRLARFVDCEEVHGIPEVGPLVVGDQCSKQEFARCGRRRRRAARGRRDWERREERDDPVFLDYNNPLGSYSATQYKGFS